MTSGQYFALIAMVLCSPRMDDWVALILAGLAILLGILLTWLDSQ